MQSRGGRIFMPVMKRELMDTPLNVSAEVHQRRHALALVVWAGQEKKQANNYNWVTPATNFSLLISRNRSRTNLCIVAPVAYRIEEIRKAQPYPRMLRKKKKAGSS